MGMDQQQNLTIADALFGKVQQRVLALLFGDPNRTYLLKEVIQLAGSGTGAVHRELRRLAASGLVTVESPGWEKHYRANRECPVFEELRSIVVKTVAVVDPLRASLQPLAERIRVAFVYGSVAKGAETTASDIDLMIIADDIAYAEVFTALQDAERKLGRPVNPNILTPDEWRARAVEEGFVRKISSQPRILVMGFDDDLG
ncbi:MAG: nucleotidyltransferase domain-containing protein [Thermoleophilia bacterium]|nr:nucleotidyltransferase domain-containing protein [Thermoleophilia bacterium]